MLGPQAGRGAEGRTGGGKGPRGGGADGGTEEGGGRGAAGGDTEERHFRVGTDVVAGFLRNGRSWRGWCAKREDLRVGIG